MVSTLVKIEIFYTTWLKFEYVIEYKRYVKSDNNFEKLIISTTKKNHFGKNRVGSKAQNGLDSLRLKKKQKFWKIQISQNALIIFF